MGEAIALVLLTLVLICCVVIVVLQVLATRREPVGSQLLAGTESKLLLVEKSLERTERSLRDDVTGQGKLLRDEVGGGISRLSDTLTKGTSEALSLQEQRSQTLFQQFTAQVHALSERLDKLTDDNRAQAEKLREHIEARLKLIQEDNAQKLEQMRQTVDEKLQGTLEKRLGESFKLVSDRLEIVHKGLGEMTNLAIGVGDLKKVLTNVKSRGTWGEVQLGNLLEQVLTIEQFSRNVAVRPGSSQRVEYAVKLPGRDGERDLWLPIDAKFPQEDYQRLVDASDRAAPDEVEAALKALETAIRAAGREISEKYVAPPHITDFAIMFLPTEGLYAEVLRRAGLADALQRETVEGWRPVGGRLAVAVDAEDRWLRPRPLEAVHRQRSGRGGAESSSPGPFLGVQRR